MTVVSMTMTPVQIIPLPFTPHVRYDTLGMNLSDDEKTNASDNYIPKCLIIDAFYGNISMKTGKCEKILTQ